MGILLKLIVAALAANAVTSFRWRRRWGTHMTVPALSSTTMRGGGGSGYDFIYDDEETINNPPPPLNPYDNQHVSYQQLQQQQQGQNPPLPGDPRAFAGTSTSSQQPPPPPLPDQFNDESLPPEEDILEMPPEAMNEEDVPPWDTTGQSNAIVEDLSAFDKDYILKGLARLYRKKILPLELASRYGHFHSPPLSPSDFDAPPMVLLLGQYSVGKTSFVKYLLGRDFPGIRVGPEPTTDRFTAILWGHQDKVIPGAALCSQMDRPFTGLSPFGNNFLSRMEAAEVNSPILKNVTIIDTPGILSGQKQRTRNYDYEAVMKWFAERSDVIIVMFDAHKLDISDELKDVMHLMIPHLDKIRVVLST